MAAIQSLGLTAALQPKLVFAENIAQAAQFGQSGNAECVHGGCAFGPERDVEQVRGGGNDYSHREREDRRQWHVFG